MHIVVCWRGFVLLVGDCDKEFDIEVSDNVKTLLAEGRNTQDRRTNHCAFNKNIEGVGFRINGGIGGGKSSCMICF